MIIPLLLKHEVHMRRPVRVPAELLQQLPHGAVVRDRVRHGLDGAEPEEAVFIAVHDAAAVGPAPRRVSVRVLHVVAARRVGLPDVDFDALDRVPCRVLDRAEDEERFALRVARHLAPRGQDARVVRVEGPQDGALGGAGGLGVVDGVDEEGEAENVGEEDEFLRDWSALQTD